MSLFETCKVRRQYLLTTIDALFLCRCCRSIQLRHSNKNVRLIFRRRTSPSGAGGSPILRYEKDRGAHRKLLFWKEPLMHQSDVNLNPPPYPGYIGLQRGFLTLLAALWVPVRSWSRTSCPEECGALVEICCNPIFRHTWSIKMADTSVHRHL